MPSPQANKPQFMFKCGSLDLNTFSVISFNGREKISMPYSFSISLRSTQSVAAQDVVGKQATLMVLRDEDLYRFSGIIEEFNYIETNVDYSTYSIKLVPRLRLLHFNQQSRVFQRMDVTQIVQKVLDDAGLKRYYTMDIQGTYPPKEFVVQYQESDLNFLSRLLEEAGIWYLFKESCVSDDEADAVGQEQLIISDKPASFEVIQGDNEILFRTQAGMIESIERQNRESISQLSCASRIISKDVFVKNYNYRTPEVNVGAQASIRDGANGKVSTWGQEFKDSDGADKAAAVMAGRIAVNRTAVNCNSDCRGMRAGSRFTLSEHALDQFSDRYLIVSIHHAGGHSSMGGDSISATYANSFQALPSALVELFRPPLNAVAPRINGIITAPIEANGSDYAALDDVGRYKVRLPFDVGDKGNFEASKYVRLAQPYSGANYGIHFPAHEGAEMIIACIDGNPNRIMGIGTIPNANTKSPVTSSNKAQSVIRTAGKNEIILDDTDAKQKISIKTAAANALLFDDENRKMVMQTTDGNSLLLDDDNQKCVWNADKNNITMDYQNKKIVITSDAGHVIEIDDQGKKITIQTADGHTVQMDDSAKTIVLKDGQGKNNVTLDGNSGLMLQSQGKIEISATQDLILKGANVKITAQAGCEIKATSDLKLKGMNLEAKADMNAKIEGGMNLEAKGGMQGKFTGGTTAELSGGAMTKVKGGIVMVN
jgi:type VI secretion system secreted protein VgrG